MFGMVALGLHQVHSAADGLTHRSADFLPAETEPEAAFDRRADVAHRIGDAAGGEGGAGQHPVHADDQAQAGLVEQVLQHGCLRFRGRDRGNE